MNAVCHIAAKAPRAGFAKTRLAAGVGSQAALLLYRGFLSDLADRFATAPFPVGWYVTPPDACAELTPLLTRPGSPLSMLAQPAGDWAERQDFLFRGARARGEDRTVLIASDSPHLEVATVADALRALDDHDIVVSPTHDGGYSLIGMRGRHDVLRGVPMGGDSALRDITARAEALGRRMAVLPPTFDLDVADDLRHLRGLLPGRADLPATAAALAALDGAGAA